MLKSTLKPAEIRKEANIEECNIFSHLATKWHPVAKINFMTKNQFINRNIQII